MPEGAPIGRRVVLGLVGLGALGVVMGSRVQNAMERALGPIVAKDGTGLSGLFPTGRFRIYSVVGYLPSRDATTYRLRVNGLVDRTLDLTLADLQARPQTAMVKDFQCVTGWRVHDVSWSGVLLAALLDEAGVQPSARAITFTSFDGTYRESLTLEQARRPDVLVALTLDHKPIAALHGGPARLYVAPMYGYKSCKWLGEITVTDRVHRGYWEERGYDVDAWIGRSNGRSDDPVR